MDTFERTVVFKGKRPAVATPALAREMKANGVKVKDMAKMWGVTPAMVYLILKQE